MSSKTKTKGYKIVSKHGEVCVKGRNIYVRYRYRRWLFKLNPVLIPLGWRREHRKVIYVNEKKVGYGEQRFGCIPIPDYTIQGKGFNVWFQNLLRRWFGWYCKKYELGYMKIRIKRDVYIILNSFTDQGNLRCDVLAGDNGELLGTLLCDANFDKLYPHIVYGGWMATMLVIAGYVTDGLIYSSVASKLNKTITVVL